MSAINEDALEEAYQRGLAAEKAGHRDEAIAAFRECLAFDPDDCGGATIRLAALGAIDTPDVAPEAYVATLFDQHADVFDHILVNQLEYGVPELVAKALAGRGSGRFRRLLDLGCGTGLVGLALESFAETAIGIDLSENMVEIAHQRGVYDELYVGEAVAFLEEADEEPFDLVVAADVLPYLGALDRFMAGLARVCAAGAVVAFSSETLSEEDFAGQPYRVGPHHRFHHDRTHVADLLNRHGFSLLSIDDIVVRLEEGEPQAGHLYLASRD